MARYYEVTAVYSREAGITGEGEDYQKAIEYYKKAVDYPNSDDAKAKSYAQFQVGELQMKLNNYDKAALAYQSTIHKFSGTEWAQLAEQRMEQLRQEGKTTMSPLKSSQNTVMQPKKEEIEKEKPAETEPVDNSNQNPESPQQF
jgi:tetratricopeptide (TPR) repeat protein